MRVLVLSLNAAGNWPPERALIAALVARGHEVHVVSDVVHEQDVIRIGAQFEPYRYAEIGLRRPRANRRSTTS